MVSTLLDSVIGCAVHTTLPAETGYSSIEIKVNFLRPIHANTGTLHAHGWVTKPGRRVAFAEGDVRDPAGKLLATAATRSSVVVAPRDALVATALVPCGRSAT